MNTLYTVHHETSHAASRRLTIWFWGGVLLSFISYTLISWGFLALVFYLFANLPENLFPFAALIGLATTLCVLFGYSRARLDAQSQTAAERAARLGAVPLDHPQHPAERQYRNIVAEMAVAAGIPPPDILLCRNDDSINAFVIGGAHDSIAIAVSAGALRYLDRDELQALVAHEFGHIVDGDIPLYGRLTAMIHGYRFIVGLGHALLNPNAGGLNTRERMLIETADVQNDAEVQAVRQLAYAAASRRMEDTQDPDNARSHFTASGVGCLLSVLLLILSAYTALLTVYARLMQAAIAREREWMADAKAVQFTRNGDALAGVFRKVLALQHLHKTPPPIHLENRHLLLINYLQNHGDKRLHTHPETCARLQRYGDYRLEDIEKLAYTLAERPPYDQAPAHDRSATHFADTLFPYALLRHHANANLPDLAPEHLLLAALMRLANATPEGLARSGTLDTAKLRPAWQALLPRHQASFLAIFLNRLQTLPPAQQRTLPIPALIRADGTLSFAEWCAHTAWYAGQTPPEPAELTHHDAEPHIRTVLRLAAHLAAPDDTARAALFAELPRHTLPIAASPWQAVRTQSSVPVPCKAEEEAGWPIEPLNIPDQNERHTARTALLELRRLRPLYRQSLTQGLATAFQQHAPLPLDAFHYLLLLEHLLTPRKTQ